MANQWNPFVLNLTGVEPLGAPRLKLPEGGIKVKITGTDIRRTKDEQGVNFVVSVRAAEGEYDGVERDVYLTVPDGRDAEKDAFFARKLLSLLVSIGYPAAQAATQFNFAPQLFAGRDAYIHVTINKDEDGKPNENLRFITAQDHARTHWSRQAGAATNGKGGTTMPALMAPSVPTAPGAPAIPQANAAPQQYAQQPMQYAPQPAAPQVGVPMAQAPQPVQPIQPGPGGNTAPLDQFFGQNQPAPAPVVSVPRPA